MSYFQTFIVKFFFHVSISSLLEWVVYYQLLSHLSQFSLFDKFQSGLRKNQSTETTPHYNIKYIILTVSLYLKKSSHSLTPLPAMSCGALQLRYCEWLHSVLFPLPPVHSLSSSDFSPHTKVRVFIHNF